MSNENNKQQNHTTPAVANNYISFPDIKQFEKRTYCLMV